MYSKNLVLFPNWEYMYIIPISFYSSQLGLTAYTKSHCMSGANQGFFRVCDYNSRSILWPSNCSDLEILRRARIKAAAVLFLFNNADSNLIKTVLGYVIWALGLEWFGHDGIWISILDLKGNHTSVEVVGELGPFASQQEKIRPLVLFLDTKCIRQRNQQYC